MSDDQTAGAASRVASLDEIVAASPLLTSIEAAMLRMNEDDLDGSLTECEKAIADHPDAAEPYFVMGVISIRCGDQGQALRMFEAAHRLNPDTREYCEALGVVYSEVGKLADGLYYSKLAMGLDPHPLLSQRMPGRLRDLAKAFMTASPSTHRIEAERLFNTGEYELARRECEAEIRLNPRSKVAYVLEGRINHALGRHSQAVGAYQAAIHLDPKDAAVPARLARSLVALGRFDEAAATAGDALRRGPDDAEIYAAAMDALLRCTCVPFETCRDLAESHGRLIAQALADDLAPTREPGTGPVRVGLISNAFYRCPGATRPLALLKNGASSTVEYRGYAISVAKDLTTTTLRGACAEWREVVDLDPFTLGLTLKAEALDVLVDLSTSEGDTRVGVMSTDAAPVRVGATLLPEPGFVPGITHVLTDETLAAVDREALLDGQDLIEIPGTLFAHEPFERLPQNLSSPWKSNDHVTFGGCTDLDRLNPECAALWSDVLRRVPDSKLLLCGDAAAESHVRSRIIEMFSMFGMADRLLFPVEDDEPDDHDLGRVLPTSQLEAIDVFLDATPFNGEQELAECLWAGIPVVTLKGDRRPAAVGASMLAAARRPDWIAHDREGFVRIASGLALDTTALDEARDSLQANVAGTPLFDTVSLSRHFAAALKQVGEAARETTGT